MLIAARKNRFVLAAALVVSGVCATTQAAQIVDVISGTTYVRGSWANFGYSFSLTEPVRVSALGLWDSFGNGLVDSHPVGIWDGTGALLAQVLVDATTPSSPSANASHAWRFEDIAPIDLAPGQYKISAYYPTTADSFVGSAVNAPGTFLFPPEVVYGQSFVTTGGNENFVEPDTTTSFNPGFFGANARFTVLPEPATLTLLAAGALALARRRR